MQTLKTRNKNLKIIILNNNGYCSIRSTQRNYFQGNYVASNVNSGLEIPNLKSLASSFGFKYFKIDNNNKHKFYELISNSQPSIIDIELIEDESLWPKVAAIQGKDGSMVSMPLEDMTPLLELEDLKKALGVNIPILESSIEARL
ncbi:hypothetical protein CL656_04340 [bacterium]|nr:hypothetical protein [bacterium]